MEQIKNKKDNNDVYELVDIAEIYKTTKDRNLKDEDAQKFVDSIMENYFLDNDNINFLEKNGISFFDFKDEESCFCMSGLNYANCCKSNLDPNIHEGYKTYVNSLANEGDYKKYVELMGKIYLETKEEISHELTCYYPNCNKEAIINNLYKNELKGNEYLTTNSINPYDAKYEMGKIFFKPVEPKQFEYKGFCKDHYEELTSLSFVNAMCDEEIIKQSFATTVYKVFTNKVELMASKKEFLKYYNSVLEDGYKAYMVVHLRKISNNLKAAVSMYDLISKYLTGESKQLRVTFAELPSTQSYRCFDFAYPQVTPKDFKVVNSVNNVLLTPKIGVVGIDVLRNKSVCYFVSDSKDEIMEQFLNQTINLIENKQKSQAAFASNVALIMTDNIIFNKTWFEELSEDDKKLYSALNKYRYETPAMGQEYIKMKFFAGFHKGNNFF